MQAPVRVVTRLTCAGRHTRMNSKLPEGTAKTNGSVRISTVRRAGQGGVVRVASTRLPTIFGVFDLIGFERANAGKDKTESALLLILGDLPNRAPLLRIHSQCLTGEVLGSLRCDCRGQLELAMSAIADEGSGLVIYEHQEGRGIGLMAKLKAYALQDRGLDTVEANQALGFDTDSRDFSLAVAILHEIGIERVRLMSNNPQKVEALTNGGIEVIELIACEAPPSPYALSYLRTKKEKMGHSLTSM
jgi:GTP cyclohydrolase II